MERQHSHDRCKHAGYYSGLGVYARDSKTLRYVLICDDCGEEMKEIHTQEYAPDPILEIAV